MKFSGTILVSFKGEAESNNSMDYVIKELCDMLLEHSISGAGVMPSNGIKAEPIECYDAETTKAILKSVRIRGHNEDTK